VAKGDPIFIKQVPWHQGYPERNPDYERHEVHRQIAPYVDRDCRYCEPECCDQGCSRCKRNEKERPEGRS
jgi:hypothetical protein